MGKYPHFLKGEISNGDFKHSGFHIIPAPLEKSVSYGKGTRRGPLAILRASEQLETLCLGKNPSDAGIYTASPLKCTGTVSSILERLEMKVAKSCQSGAIPVILGGEHSISYASIAAVSKNSSHQIGILHFDAHCDLRLNYGGNPFSHASVMRRVCDDFNLPLFQIGTRAYCQEENDYRKVREIEYVDGGDPRLEKPGSIQLPDSFPETIYLSFDIDAFDPSLLPCTGTPVPGGLQWNQTIRLLQTLLQEKTLAGFDCVELSPRRRQPHCSFTAAQLVYSVMALAV